MSVNRSSLGLGSCVLLALVSGVCCISVEAPAEVSVVRGSSVTLSCSFSSSSSVTSRMSVDWSFREEGGVNDQVFFHFLSRAYLPEDERFRGRVQWLGSPSRGDASIRLINTTLTDNGTYSCSVLNPPDTHGSPAHTRLTVTPQRVSVALTDVGVLLLFVLLPSALLTLLLLLRMLCVCDSASDQRPALHSPIEVVSGDDYMYTMPQVKHSVCCCYLKDSDYEDDYIHEKVPEHAFTDH